MLLPGPLPLEILIFIGLGEGLCIAFLKKAEFMTQ